jgi:hypothetical protein
VHAHIQGIKRPLVAMLLLLRKKRGEKPGMRRTYFRTGPFWCPTNIVYYYYGCYTISCCACAHPREPRRDQISITSGSHVTTKKKTRGKTGHAQTLLPVRASPGHVTFSLPVKRPPLERIWPASGCACAEHTSEQCT